MIQLLALLCVASVLGSADSAAGDWIQGRATYFDAPPYWKESFPPGKFGDLWGGSCSYVNRRAGVQPTNADLPFPLDAVGAVTDVMRDYTGGCGRCYEIRCKTGPILFDKNTTISIYEGYHLPRFAPPGLKDPEGREWPGVPTTVDEDIRWTQCRDESTSIFITIIDTCPCIFRGGRRQKWCCGPIDHFDLSFWAFDKLAHPLYGMMMLEYRPVDCTSREPLNNEELFISSTIYGDRPEAGWGWTAFFEKESTMIAENQGRDNSAATCVRLTPGGGLAFWCRKCHLPGAQPFGNGKAVEFWVRSNADDEYTFTPRGEAPRLKLFLSQMHEPKYTTTGTETEPEKFCNRKPDLGDYVPLIQDGDWFKFSVPLADFQCTGHISTSTANRIVFVNPGAGDGGDAVFCLDELKIV